ncbi:MAG TPA: deoxyribodipyrimidine photo-lyase, partial [Propionicimonas sp.]|nr:deoxyribodipyrimidine photo-lyase [Propionicimonas sp.]HRA05229.1 deoxyribodipyrimidine photo-lyase [Propionicimonas sp.]
MSEARLVWFRRDLRLHDHPALTAAAKDGPVVPLFVVDPAFFDSAGPVRPAWLAANLIALDASLGGRLCVRFGDPREVVPRTAAEIGAMQVHVSTETEPAGAARD